MLPWHLRWLPSFCGPGTHLHILDPLPDDPVKDRPCSSSRVLPPSSTGRMTNSPLLGSLSLGLPSLASYIIAVQPPRSIFRLLWILWRSKNPSNDDATPPCNGHANFWATRRAHPPLLRSEPEPLPPHRRPEAANFWCSVPLQPGRLGRSPAGWACQATDRSRVSSRLLLAANPPADDSWAIHRVRYHRIFQANQNLKRAFSSLTLFLTFRTRVYPLSRYSLFTSRQRYAALDRHPPNPELILPSTP